MNKSALAVLLTAALLLPSAARADIDVSSYLSNADAGVWITIYDASKNVQFAHGCMGPRSHKTWTNAAFNNTLGAKAFILRAEVTPDGGCTKPKICDTTMAIGGHADVSIQSSDPGSVKCYVNSTATMADVQANDAALKQKQAQEQGAAYSALPGCLADIRPLYSTAQSLYDRLIATGKAPSAVKDQLYVLNAAKARVNMSMTPYNFDAKVALQDCRWQPGYLDKANAAMAPYVNLLTAPGKAVSTLVGRVQVILTAVDSSGHRLGACAMKLPVFQMGRMKPTDDVGTALKSQLQSYAGDLAKNTSTNAKDYDAAQKKIDGLQGQADKFSSAVDAQCATVK